MAELIAEAAGRAIRNLKEQRDDAAYALEAAISFLTHGKEFPQMFDDDLETTLALMRAARDLARTPPANLALLCDDAA